MLPLLELQIIPSNDKVLVQWECDSSEWGIKEHKIRMPLVGTLEWKIWQITRANITWDHTTSMSDHGIYTCKVLLWTYQGHRVRAL
jgi:hypothetical protein